MRLLVVGGAGFVGSNCVRRWVSAGREVAVYDLFTYAGRPENLQDVRDRIAIVRGDVADEAALDRAVADHRPDLVVNFAAESHVDRSINEPARFVRTNVLGVFALMEVARRRRVPVVHISTDEVYGDVHGLPPAGEEAPLRPSSPYSASKASGDLFILSYARTYGVDAKIVRPSNMYGPYQHPEKLIPRTVARILMGRPAVIYGDGGDVRDYLYVEDFCEALDAIIERGRHVIYNVPGGNPRTVREVVESVVGILGRGEVRRGRARPGGDRAYAMEGRRVAELGWRPRTPWEAGLRRTVEWYLANRWWWEPLVDGYVLRDEPW
ncbi:MAG: dTDP-glucose 4,6-dehydratase [Thermoproteus sp.]|jgi:dTDP-glucose 4,6-dehydratase|nr:dTDP-glucose 4,6-dehydratase [Thermoproteus sp.]MDT7882349.1 dTDP-glucose 4,6-dehydratase [Thermoproteus sp.]